MRNIRSRQKAQIHWDKVSSEETTIDSYLFVYFQRFTSGVMNSASASAPFVFLK